MMRLHKGNIEELRRHVTHAVTRGLLRRPPTGSSAPSGVRSTDVRRVLVCRPNHRLGNLVLLTPLIRELQHRLPAAEVDIVLAGGNNAALFSTFRNVGHVYVLSRRLVHHPLQTLGIARQIRHARYDLIIDPCEGSQSSHWLVAYAHAPHVISVPDDASGANAAQMPRHMAQRPVCLLRRAIALRAGPGAALYPPLDLNLTPDEQLRGQQILRTLVPAGAQLPNVIGVFADATGTKRYPEAWWDALLRSLRQRLADTVIVEIAPPDGRSRLSAQLPAFFSPNIREVAAVISQMTCFISADCGVMHLACASGVSTFGLFSVTDMPKYAPYGAHNAGIDTRHHDPEQIASTIIAATPALRSLGGAALQAEDSGMGAAQSTHSLVAH